MTFWEWLADRRIRDALSEGQFDGLSGAGKPLAMEDDALVPPGWRAAFHLLRQSGLAPAWIMLDVEIRHDAQAARQAFLRAIVDLDDGEPEYARAVDRFRQRLAEINRAIDDFNLQVPVPQLARGRMRPEVEMRRIIRHVKQA
jgi:hypothetical protein